MPTWLHSLTTHLVNYGTRRGLVLRWDSRVALWAASRLLSVTMKAGVWGRL